MKETPGHPARSSTRSTRGKARRPSAAHSSTDRKTSCCVLPRRRALPDGRPRDRRQPQHGERDVRVPRDARARPVRPTPSAPARARIARCPIAWSSSATSDNIYYYDDSKGTNVASVAASVRGFPRPLVLIAGGVDKGGSYEPMLEALDGVCKGIILIGKAAPLIREAAAAHRVTLSGARRRRHARCRAPRDRAVRERRRGRAVARVRELRHVPELRPPRPRVPRSGQRGRREATRRLVRRILAGMRALLLACVLVACGKPEPMPPKRPNTELIGGEFGAQTARRIPPRRGFAATARSSSRTTRKSSTPSRLRPGGSASTATSSRSPTRAARCAPPASRVSSPS